MNVNDMNYCFTLSYNFPSEVEKITKLLYELNDPADFKHLIIDLGFPLNVDEIPDDIEKERKQTSKLLKDVASKYGSKYVKMPNIGVSQNWTQAYNYLKPTDSDVLIGCDPDEHPLDKDWVRAMGDVAIQGRFGMVCLIMPEQIPLLSRVAYTEAWVAGHRVYVLPAGAMNWALMGINGAFFNKMKEMPVPDHAERYGWIEGALTPQFFIHGMYYCLLADYKVQHTDFETNEPGASSLLRGWKNQIVHNIHQYGQLSFEDWLKMKKEDRI